MRQVLIRTAGLWLAVLAAAAGCDRGGAESSSGVDRRPAFPVLAVGDSYTIGQSVPAVERWPVKLGAMLRAEGVDCGDPLVVARTGWTTREMIEALDGSGVEKRGPYAVVTVLAGVNDQYRGRAVGAFREDFRELLGRAVRLAGGKGERVVVVSIPDWGVTPFGVGTGRGAEVGKEIDAFNEVCRAEAELAGAAWVDVTPGSRGAATRPGLVAEDGLHPSGEMYAEWARAVLPAARGAVGR